MGELLTSACSLFKFKPAYFFFFHNVQCMNLSKAYVGCGFYYISKFAVNTSTCFF